MILPFSTIYNKMTGIYKIVNPHGKTYIGQSTDIEKRFEQYSKLLNCKPQIKLYRSLKKYGAEKHRYEILEECLEHELNTRERFYQDLYDVLRTGLNCRLTTTVAKSGKNSLESNQKRSASMKGKNTGPRPDVSERNKSIHKGKTISEEQKQKISNKLKGRTRTKEEKSKISEKLSKPVQQWTADRQVLLREWKSLTAAAEAVDRGASGIFRVVSGKGKTCAGYYWKYAI